MLAIRNALIREMKKNPNTGISRLVLNSIKSHKFQKNHKNSVRVACDKPIVMGFREYVGMACRDEQAFEEIVKRESKSISLPVRLFLQDKIRNAVTGLDNERTKRIVSALQVVGL